MVSKKAETAFENFVALPMHVMLADSIDGGILVILILFIGLAAAVLALIGLVPAWQGSRLPTFLMVSPAIIAALTITGWLGYGFITEGLKDSEALPMDFFGPWLILAGGPALAAGITLLVLWARWRKRQRQAAEANLLQ